MKIEANGIVIEARVEGASLHYRVLKQSKLATKALGLLGVVNDEGTGFSLRSNEKPAYNKGLKRFFVRGTEEGENEKEVICKFKNATEANRALEGLNNLVGKVKMPQVSPDSPNLRYEKGCTAGIRFALLHKRQAMSLDLTGKHHFPDARFWIPGTKPLVTRNKHFTEHIGQAVDVLNKAAEKPVKVEGVINPHKVTPQQAKLALKALREYFDNAEQGNYLVAAWRLLTGVRGPDYEHAEIAPGEFEEANHP